MLKKAVTGLIIVAVCLSMAVAVWQGSNRSTGVPGVSSSGDIGVIRISGTIASGTSGSSWFSAISGSETIMQQLRTAGKNPSIKAVILRLDTPGGSAAASQEISLEIDRLREQGVIVVASMGDIAASGGYWIASHCDKIMANPGTMTGSIGVIMETQNMQGLYEQLGIDPITFKSGPYKDMGSSSREVTEEEIAIFQAMIDDVYNQFVDTVSQGRGMTRSEVLLLADGRVFTGNQAKENGLIDELGNYYDAIELAASLAEITGEPSVVDLTPKYTWLDMLGSTSLSGSLSPDLLTELMAEKLLSL